MKEIIYKAEKNERNGMKQRKMKTTYAFRFVGLSVKIKVDAILWWLENVESLWIKEIIEFFVSLVCVCCLVYCVIRGLETFTIISSPKANFLIWCHITWNAIKT
jgi:hypothetical protein